MIVNKYDLNMDMTEKIEKYCKEKDIDLIGKVPFDKSIVEAMVSGKTIIEHKKGHAQEEIRKIWGMLQKEF